jgi:hypothetical protein
MLICRGPHHTNNGNREFRQMLTAIRKLAGHAARAPSAVADQSIARIRFPISPQPTIQSATGAGWAAASFATGSSNQNSRSTSPGAAPPATPGRLTPPRA